MKFYNVLCFVCEALKIVYSLESNAVGYGMINLKMVEYILPFCIDAVTHIVNCSLDDSIGKDL